MCVVGTSIGHLAISRSLEDQFIRPWWKKYRDNWDRFRRDVSQMRCIRWRKGDGGGTPVRRAGKPGVTVLMDGSVGNLVLAQIDKNVRLKRAPIPYGLESREWL